MKWGFFVFLDLLGFVPAHELTESYSIVKNQLALAFKQDVVPVARFLLSLRAFVVLQHSKLYLFLVVVESDAAQLIAVLPVIDRIVVAVDCVVFVVVGRQRRRGVGR